MKDDTLLQIASTFVALILAGILTWVLDRLRKRHLEPMTKLLEGTSKEPDIRQMMGSMEANTLISAKNSAAAVQGVFQVRDDLQLARTEIRSEINAVKDQVKTLENKVDTNRAHHDARADEQGSQIRDLLSNDRGLADQVARIETVVARRGADKAMHDAAVVSIDSRKDRS